MMENNPYGRDCGSKFRVRKGIPIRTRAAAVYPEKNANLCSFMPSVICLIQGAISPAPTMAPPGNRRRAAAGPTRTAGRISCVEQLGLMTQLDSARLEVLAQHYRGEAET